MNNLYKKNIAYFSRYYKLVAAAVAVTVAIVAGSLTVGESVRFTLAKRVGERLGNAETVVFSRSSFMESSMLRRDSIFDDARGILLSNGFIPASGRLIPVVVWGVDDMDIPPDGAKLNAALSAELGDAYGDDVVLRLPATGLTPSGSLFVTSRYTTGMRLSPAGIVDVESGGNISLKNEQTIPLNIFVNRATLAEAMKVEGKINLILSGRLIAAADIDRAWSYDLSGLRVAQKGSGAEITSDRIFLQDEAVQLIRRDNPSANRLFSYLVNSIEAGTQSIPYSFVTAAERYGGVALQKDEVILSDYAATRLAVKAGDVVQLASFTSRDLKTLSVDTVWLRVLQVVPLSVFCTDSTLSADFPGLSDVESCTAWDSDLPINMQLVGREDERYWELYRTTPKAIVAYEAVADCWSNAYGSATAIRVDTPEVNLNALRAGLFGIQLIYPRATGLYAALNGVDFSGLFLALGIFVIVSAALLMLVPLSEMLHRRKGEVELLCALGYTKRRVTQLLWREAAPVALAASLVGVLLGLLYTRLVMFLLGSVWRGATHTGGFVVFPDATAVGIGLIAGAGVSLLLLRVAIARSLREAEAARRGVSPKTPSPQKLRQIAALLLLLAAAVVVLNLAVTQSATLFVLVGATLLAAATLWGSYIICQRRFAWNADGRATTLKSSFSTTTLAWATLYATRRQALLSFLTLATGVFTVFAVGLNRRGFADSSRLQSGTGGYTLWCESAVPIYHNVGTQAGREKLAIANLPANAEAMQCLKYSADDASCLNLNKVSTPAVLGVDMALLAKSRFEVAQALHPAGRETFFAAMQVQADSVYPALVDETVLLWSLGMRLGDVIRYEGSNGRPVLVQLVGTLKNSIFQGHILIDKKLFAEAWSDVTGSEMLLLKVDEADSRDAKMLLEQALSEYGVRVTTTAGRLQELNSVTDAYLTIFMTLGGLGLLLGVFGFAIVVRKNLVARSGEVGLYRALGFADEEIARTVYRESLMVPLYAIGVGAACSLVGVAGSLANVGAGLWLMTALLLALFVVSLLAFVKTVTARVVDN